MERQADVNPASRKDHQDTRYCLYRDQRFMHYSQYRSNDSPIVSGIVESACRQVVTEQLKLPGMRKCHAGARQIMTLCSILLSRTETVAFRNALPGLPAVNSLISQ